MNSRPDDDNAFEEYLGGRSAVSRHYRAMDNAAVPADLDAGILAQAAAAVSGDAADDLARVRRRRRHLMRWGVPAALAASAVLVVSIVIRGDIEYANAPAEPRPMAKEESAGAAGEAARQAGPDEASESVIMIAPPRDAVTEFSSYGRASMPQESEKRTREPVSLDQAPPQAPAPAPAPPSAAATAQRNDAVIAETREALADRMQEQEAKATMSAAAAQRMAAPVQRQTSEIDQSANRASAAISAARLHASPEDWLEHIRELRRAGQQATADREWQEFAKTYPGFTVAPADAARPSPATAPSIDR